MRTFKQHQCSERENSSGDHRFALSTADVAERLADLGVMVSRETIWHRALNEEPDRLAKVLCWRENRYVGKQLTFSYDRKRIVSEENELSRGLVGKYVGTYVFVDGRFEVRWKGQALPYSAFDMDQRVTHAAVTEDKRLGAVLAYVKEMQDAAPPKAALESVIRKLPIILRGENTPV